MATEQFCLVSNDLWKLLDEQGAKSIADFYLGIQTAEMPGIKWPTFVSRGFPKDLIGFYGADGRWLGGIRIAEEALAEKDKEIAELKEQLRWRKYPDEKPERGQLINRIIIETNYYSTLRYTGLDLWNGDLWQPITEYKP